MGGGLNSMGGPETPGVEGTPWGVNPRELPPRATKCRLDMVRGREETKTPSHPFSRLIQQGGPKRVSPPSIELRIWRCSLSTRRTRQRRRAVME